ncbi:MAG: hypothetical protein WAT09_04005 [Paracoccaceae bacterium]
MRGVHIAGHDRKKLDIVPFKGPGQFRALANLDFVKGAVFDELHGGFAFVSGVLAASAANVIGAIDEGDISGDLPRQIADQPDGHITNIC